MSKARWTTDNDLFLLQLFEEHNGNWDIIEKFIPNRNKNAIKKRYLFLEKISAENNKSIKDYIESIRTDEIEQIQDLFCFQNRNDKILKKIIKKQYAVSDVVKAILLLSNKYNMLCMKLAYNFKYLMIEWCKEIYIELINISSQIRSDCFLQHCCFLNIFEYEDDPSFQLLEAQSIIDSINMSQNVFEKINNGDNKKYEDDKQISNKEIKAPPKENEVRKGLKNDLTKIMNLLFSLLQEKNEVSILNPQIRSILIENESDENNNLDIEFHNAINNFAEIDS